MATPTYNLSGINPQSLQQQIRGPRPGQSPFSTALNFAGQAAGVAGNMLFAGGQNVPGSMVTAVASGLGGGAAGMPGVPPGFPGAGGVGGGLGGAPGLGGVGGAGANFDQMISQMGQQQMDLIFTQQKVQNQAQFITAVTNITKTDGEAKMNALRNFRA